MDDGNAQWQADRCFGNSLRAAVRAVPLGVLLGQWHKIISGPDIAFHFLLLCCGPIGIIIVWEIFNYTRPIALVILLILIFDVLLISYDAYDTIVERLATKPSELQKLFEDGTYMTDGGHYENTGLLRLFADPHVNVIVLSDGSHDPWMQFQDLQRVLDLARKEQSISFQVANKSCPLCHVSDVSRHLAHILESDDRPIGLHTGLGALENSKVCILKLYFSRQKEPAYVKPPLHIIKGSSTIERFANVVAKDPYQRSFASFADPEECTCCKYFSLCSGCRDPCCSWCGKFPHHGTFIIDPLITPPVFEAYHHLGFVAASQIIPDLRNDLMLNGGGYISTRSRKLPLHTHNASSVQPNISDRQVKSCCRLSGCSTSTQVSDGELHPKYAVPEVRHEELRDVSLYRVSAEHAMEML